MSEHRQVRGDLFASDPDSTFRVESAFARLFERSSLAKPMAQRPEAFVQSGPAGQAQARGVLFGSGAGDTGDLDSGMW